MSELDEKALDSARWAYSRELYTGSHMSHIGAAEASLAAAIRAYLAASPASGEPDVDRCAQSVAGMVAEWYGSKFEPKPHIPAHLIARHIARFTHPTSTKDDVLEEAAKKADRIAEIIKRNLYRQHEKVEDARMFALQLADDLRSLKGGKA